VFEHLPYAAGLPIKNQDTWGLSRCSDNSRKHHYAKFGRSALEEIPANRLTKIWPLSGSP